MHVPIAPVPPCMPAQAWAPVSARGGDGTIAPVVTTLLAWASAVFVIIQLLAHACNRSSTALIVRTWTARYNKTNLPHKKH
jgi:hypothetical protein